MILIYPLLLIWAGLMVARSSGRRSTGWSGFAVWAMAGAVFSFSLLTGFSIGLLLLPIVVGALYVAARTAPDFRASLGLLAGIAATLLGVPSIHTFSPGWLIPGAAIVAVALGSFLTTQVVRRGGP